LIVLALLAALVAPNVFRHVATAKDIAAGSQIELLGPLSTRIAWITAAIPLPSRGSPRSGRRPRRTHGRRIGAGIVNP
jgi:hypothetical protein